MSSHASGTRAVKDAAELVLSEEPVQRTTLSTQLADRLIKLIGHDNLRPGDELPSEARLAAAFKVSRPVVREALRHLAALRMVELANGKPARVMPITPDLLGVYFEWAVRQDVKSILELHELRQGVESMSAELAASRATVDEKDALRSIIQKMRSSLDDMAVYAELDAQLHMSIIASTHNSLLLHLAESIRGPLRLSITAGLDISTDQVLQRIQGRHEDIVEAIITGDGRRAAKLMHEHIGGASRRIAASTSQ